MPASWSVILEDCHIFKVHFTAYLIFKRDSSFYVWQLRVCYLFPNGLLEINRSIRIEVPHAYFLFRIKGKLLTYLRRVFKDMNQFTLWIAFHIGFRSTVVSTFYWNQFQRGKLEVDIQLTRLSARIGWNAKLTLWYSRHYVQHSMVDKWQIID